VTGWEWGGLAAPAFAGIGIASWATWRRIQWGKPQWIDITAKRNAEFLDDERH